MTRHENAAAYLRSGVERLQLGHQSALSISLTLPTRYSLDFPEDVTNTTGHEVLLYLRRYST